jgi:hypothetical protein
MHSASPQLYRWVVLPVQALGIAVDIGPEGVAECLDGAGVGFMFAPRCVALSLPK